MATRESNVIMFPQPIDPERKEDIRIAEQFLEKIDGLMMKGLLRHLEAAEAKDLAERLAEIRQHVAVLTNDKDANALSGSDPEQAQLLIHA